MYVCICTYACMHLHFYDCLCMYGQMCACMHACVWMNDYMHMNEYIYVYEWSCGYEMYGCKKCEWMNECMSLMYVCEYIVCIGMYVNVCVCLSYQSVGNMEEDRWMIVWVWNVWMQKVCMNERMHVFNVCMWIYCVHRNVCQCACACVHACVCVFVLSICRQHGGG